MKVKMFITAGILSLMLCACGGQQAETGSNAQELEDDLQAINDIAQIDTSEQWYSAYQAILNDWTMIDEYGDFEYLKMFFDSKYQFDNYWLCDVNSDGTPELFLHSDYMGITAVFTYYENQVYSLMYDVIYGINKETGDIVIEGHWHGAGGSGVDEWTVYHITSSEAVYSYYIDFYREYKEIGMDKPYTIYDAATDENHYEMQYDSREYDEIYNIHVKPCILASNYQRYDLSDLKGLDVVQ